MTSKDSDPHDGASVRFPPPLVPLIALGLGELLRRFVQPLPIPVPGLARIGLGLLLLTAGVLLIAAALGLFRRSGQNPEPWASTPEIISTGIYRFSRNPMYLSLGLLQAGIGVLLANAWMVLFVPIVWAVIYRIAIRHEEAYLERKFGGAYTDYKQSVRRWV